MKFRAIILVLMFASANFVPSATFALSKTTTLCSSNHGNDVPPVHAHSDCPHTSHGLNLTFVATSHHFEVSTEADEILYPGFEIVFNSTSYLDKLFKPPRQ